MFSYSDLPFFKQIGSIIFVKQQKAVIVDINGKIANIDPKKYFLDENSLKEDRKLTGAEYSRRPIVLLGCSYTFGHGLSKEENFSGVLSKYTHRPVYNYARDGAGPLEEYNFLYTDFNSPIWNKSSDKPEFIIYTYMFNQVWRLLQGIENINQTDLPHKHIGESQVSYIFYKQYLYGKNYVNIDNSLNFMKIIFTEMNKHFKKISPDSKFILLLYQDKISSGPSSLQYKIEKMTLEKSTWKDLEKEGISVISTEDLVGEKFLSPDYMLKYDYDKICSFHPSAKVWKVLVPKLVKKFNM